MTYVNNTILSDADYQHLRDNHFTKLGKLAKNQLDRAWRYPSHLFWDKYLWPNLLIGAQGQPWQPDQQWPVAASLPDQVDQRPSYIPLGFSIYEPGRSQEFSLVAVTDTSPNANVASTYFANPLRFGKPDSAGNWDAPSGRVHPGPFWVFTIEYDAPSDWTKDQKIQFLADQLGWFCKGNNDLDRKARVFWDFGAQFSDFRGICACYSGHKSVHIHLVFDTRAAFSDPLVQGLDLRSAYQALHREMCDHFNRVFPQAVEPDPALGQPEQWRRVPNGTLINDKKDHILGIPEGTLVPQLVLWEKFVSRACKGANKRFVDPTKVAQLAKQARACPIHAASSIGSLEADEHAHCEQQLREIIEFANAGDEYPKLDRLEYKGNTWKAFLYAAEDDRNPNVVIYENSHESHATGGKQPLKHVLLDVPLGFYLSLFLKEFRGEIALDHGSEPNAVERRFAERSVCRITARKALREAIDRLTRDHPVLMLCAPEGIGKTTTIWNMLSELRSRYRLSSMRNQMTGTANGKNTFNKLARENRQLPKLGIVCSFADYVMLDEKCNEFNEMKKGIGFWAVVVPSFSRCYQQACDALGTTDADLITQERAGELGCESVATAIRLHQPDVWQRMEEIRDVALALPSHVDSTAQIVWFVAHQTMQLWKRSCMPAAFAHRDFFKVEPREWWSLAEENRLGLAVHDEVSYQHLVHIHPAELVDWCRRLFKQDKEVWSSEEGHLGNKWKSYHAYIERNPIFVDKINKLTGEVEKVLLDFDDVLEIASINYRNADKVKLQCLELYGIKARMYHSAKGKIWYVKPTTWWRGLAEQTILLTTEQLPCDIVERWQAKDIPNGLRPAVYRLAMPQMSANNIDVAVWRSCKAGNTPQNIMKIRQEPGCSDIFVVSDRSHGIPRTATHKGIRGSDRLTGQDVAQTAYYKSPAEYEELQALNQRFGMDDAIRISHIDQINQTAGRNLGFRANNQSYMHKLVLCNNLMIELKEHLIDKMRYPIRTTADAVKRKNDCQRFASWVSGDIDGQIAA